MKKDMQLRPFAYADADTVLGWCRTERAFRLWSADRFKRFPASADELWENSTGENRFPVVMTEDGRVTGFMLLRYPSEDHSIVRFGFVIVDNSMRGKGYGKRMLRLAIARAREQLGAKKITLGVFVDNPAALECYRSVGFRTVEEKDWTIDGEEMKGLEMELLC